MLFFAGKFLRIRTNNCARLPNQQSLQQQRIEYTRMIHIRAVAFIFHQKNKTSMRLKKSKLFCIFSKTSLIYQSADFILLDIIRRMRRAKKVGGIGKTGDNPPLTAAMGE